MKSLAGLPPHEVALVVMLTYALRDLRSVIDLALEERYEVGHIAEALDVTPETLDAIMRSRRA